MQHAVRKVSVLPELHDAGDIAGRVDASDVVEISHVEAPIDPPRQSHGRQQFVTLGKSITAGAGDAPAPAVPHDRGDNGRLERDELVLSAAFVKNPCRTKCSHYYWCVIPRWRYSLAQNPELNKTKAQKNEGFLFTWI